MTTKELDSKYVASTYARFPVCLVSGKGSLVYDEDGKEYIDLGTGIAVNTFGYCDDEWIGAINIKHLSLTFYARGALLMYSISESEVFSTLPLIAAIVSLRSRMPTSAPE